MSEEQIPTQKVIMPELQARKPARKDSPTEEVAIADDGTKTSGIAESALEKPISRSPIRTLELSLDRVSSGDLVAVESLAERLIKGTKETLTEEDLLKVQGLTDEALKIAIEIKKNIIASKRAIGELSDESEIDKRLSEQMPNILYVAYTAYPTFADELVDEQSKADFTQRYLDIYNTYGTRPITREVLDERSLVVLMKNVHAYRNLFSTKTYRDDMAVADELVKKSLLILHDSRVPEEVNIDNITANMAVAMQLEESAMRSRKKQKIVHTENEALAKDTPKEIKDIYNDPRQQELYKERLDHALIEMATALSIVHVGDDVRIQNLKAELQATMPAFVPELGTPLYADDLGNISVTQQEGFTKSWLVSGYDSLNKNIIVCEEGVLNPNYAALGLKGDESGLHLEYIVTPGIEIEAKQSNKAIEDAQESIKFSKSIQEVSSFEELKALIDSTPTYEEIPNSSGEIIGTRYADITLINPLTSKIITHKQDLLANIQEIIKGRVGYLDSIPEEYGLKEKVIELAEQEKQRREGVKLEAYVHAIAAVHALEDMNRVIDEGYAKGFSVTSPEEHTYLDKERLKVRIKEYVEGALPENSRIISTKDPLYKKVEELKKEYSLAHVRAKLESFTF